MIVADRRFELLRLRHVHMATYKIGVLLALFDIVEKIQSSVIMHA